MPTKSVLPLLLLVLLVWNEDTGVICQNVNVTNVKTDHVELTWERSGKWLGVSEFTVQFSTPESSVCKEVISCQTVDCRFDSSETCGVVDACTKTTTVVSGGDYTAPEVFRVTGPEGVTNLTLNIDQGVLHITWNNPSMESSSCYEETAVRVSFIGKPTTTYHGIDKEYQDVEMCIDRARSGYVDVWTISTDGESYTDSSNFIYEDVVDLVTLKPCKPLGCTSLQASWEYVPVCSDVVSFKVWMYGNFYAADIDSTNMTITGLQPSVDYTLCVMAMHALGWYIDQDCQTCYSISAVVSNLQVVTSLQNNSALKVTWDPPPCNVTHITYEITYTSFLNSYQYHISYNSIVLDNLCDYYYNVCVKVDGGPADPICTPGFSTIQEPSFITTSDLNETVLNGESPLLVRWDFDDSKYPGVNITYQLTWGSEQQYNASSQKKDYTIQKYTNPEDSHRFCVAAIPDRKDDLMSAERCITKYTESRQNKSSSGLIIGLSVALGIIVLVLIIGLGFHFYKRRH